MSFDGFEPSHSDAFAGFDATTATRVFSTIDRVARVLHLEVHGLEQLPQGPALLVANHAFGWDAAFLMAAVWRAKQQPLWALGEHLWWRVPFLRGVAAACGTVDGTHENLDRLLSREQLVLVLPGGLREAVKPASLRYRLLWGRRYGFVRAAIRNGVPVVPVASVGTDELFDFMGDAYERGRRWTRGRLPIPIPLPRRILPLPHLAALRFVVGTPITPPAVVDGADEQLVIERFRREIAGALHELIDNELARRAGIEFRG